MGDYGSPQILGASAEATAPMVAVQALYTVALRVLVQFQQFWRSSFLSWVLPFFVLVPRCIWAVACIWLTQFVGCNNFEFRNNLSGVTAL